MHPVATAITVIVPYASVARFARVGVFVHSDEMAMFTFAQPQLSGIPCPWFTPVCISPVVLVIFVSVHYDSKDPKRFRVAVLVQRRIDPDFHSVARVGDRPAEPKESVQMQACERCFGRISGPLSSCHG